MMYCKLDPFNLSERLSRLQSYAGNPINVVRRPNLKRPYFDQSNFAVQQQVTPKAVLTANYVGSIGASST